MEFMRLFFAVQNAKAAGRERFHLEFARHDLHRRYPFDVRTDHIHKHPAVCKAARDDDSIHLAANDARKVGYALGMSPRHSLENELGLFIAALDHSFNFERVAGAHQRRETRLAADIAAHLLLGVLAAVAELGKAHRLDPAAALGREARVVVAVAIDTAALMHEPGRAAAADMVHDYRAVLKLFAEHLLGAFAGHCTAVEHVAAARLFYLAHARYARNVLKLIDRNGVVDHRGDTEGLCYRVRKHAGEV